MSVSKCWVIAVKVRQTTYYVKFLSEANPRPGEYHLAGLKDSASHFTGEDIAESYLDYVTRHNTGDEAPKVEYYKEIEVD